MGKRKMNKTENESLTDEEKIKLEILLADIDEVNDDFVEKEVNINEKEEIYENPFKCDNTINHEALRKLKELEEQLNEFTFDGPLDRQMLSDQFQETIDQDERDGNYKKIEERLKNIEEKLNEIKREDELPNHEIEENFDDPSQICS